MTVHSRLAPDGQSILHGAYQLEWHDLNSREVKVIKQEPTIGYLSPTISPDGKQIAYWQWRDGTSGVSNIVVANGSGSDARVVCRCDRKRNWPDNVLTWTPDQRYLVFADDAGTLWRVPVNGGEPERIGVSMDGSIQGPQVQPDGRGLLLHDAERLESCRTVGSGELPAGSIGAIGGSSGGSIGICPRITCWVVSSVRSRSSGEAAPRTVS
jgi:hypothetical protein